MRVLLEEEESLPARGQSRLETVWQGLPRHYCARIVNEYSLRHILPPLLGYSSPRLRETGRALLGVVGIARYQMNQSGCKQSMGDLLCR